MVDVDVSRGGPDAPVVRRLPGAARRVAITADLDARAVALQHVLARVARPRDGDPRRE